MGIPIANVFILAASVVAFIFIAACTGGNQWVKISGTTDGYEMGLWKNCSIGLSSTMCFDQPANLPSWFDAARALSILACLLGVAAILFGGLPILTEKLPSLLLVSVSSFAGAFAMAMALIVFSSNYTAIVSYSYGWCFVLGCLGVCLLLVAGTMAIVFKKYTQGQNTN